MPTESARQALAVVALLRALADEIEATIPTQPVPESRTGWRLIVGGGSDTAGVRERARRRAPYP